MAVFINRLFFKWGFVTRVTLGNKINNTRTSKGQYPPWRQRLEAKIKATQRHFSQLSAIQKGDSPRYTTNSIPEALEIAKLGSHSSGYLDLTILEDYIGERSIT